ncbi:SLAP domain-containing protein [Lactobacillus sp. ESL0680]|uniref:SLAP domain-containing protein n=1 Tax=Lactobacillus sp. ESL0680 TaxID=2983210 RepID=UPI0023F7496C|nr:SLAP domain-containing protein [Lactobacillus sp. ESL0680]WEV38625.1 SLAP domain-containing protein [Lactobacillus sp. ESL0680]
MKKSKYFKFIASSTLALGLVGLSNAQSNNQNTVFAASTYQVLLTHNSYIYNSIGHKVSGPSLKKGTKQKIAATKKINGKNYLKLKKNRYIKQANTKKVTDTTSYINIDDSRQVYLKPNGEKQQLWVTGKNKIYETMITSDGMTWYRIGESKWIKSVPDPDMDITDSTNKPAASNSENNTQTAAPTKDMLTTDYKLAVEKRFVEDVNNWRAQADIKPLTINPELHDYATQRAIEAGNYHEKYHTSDKHTRPDGSISAHGEVETGEVLTRNPNDLADDAFNEFIYNDASANWGHRDLLKNSECTRIGVSIGFAGMYGSDDPVVTTMFIANLDY